MNNRKYYSLRNSESNKIELDPLKEIVFSIYQDFRDRGYFQEYLGTECADGDMPGKAGNLEGYILRKLRKTDLWPFDTNYRNYSEEDLFDMVEFFFDHISAPLEKGARYHDWNECGWHYANFDDLSLGAVEFSEEINQFINDYGDGYELSAKGEILSLAPAHLRSLMDAPIPTKRKNIIEKMEHAAAKFKKYGSTINDRADAIKSLVDCLEFLRPEIKEVLYRKDENDLFNIANNFGIRHSNKQQKTSYDKNIWLSWMFYFYYATLMTCLHLIRKRAKEEDIKIEKNN